MKPRLFLATVPVSLAVLVILVSLTMPARPALADGSPSVAEIVARTNFVAYCQGNDGQAQVKMTIVDNQGRKRLREFAIVRLDEPAPDNLPAAEQAIHCGKQRYYVYFRRPADVNKTAFLVWKNPGKSDDRWLYLPALDLVKRVSSADKRTSFVGSDFFYEDVSGRATTEDEHTLVKTTKNYYVLRNTPKDPQSVEFGSYKMWIHRDTFVVVKVEYFDKKGTKYREYKATKVEKVQGYPTVVRATMKDLRTGGYTELGYGKVKYDVGLPKQVFTERSLRRAPRKYLF